MCRSAASLVMNRADKWRSRVECKWTVDLALKLRRADARHRSIADETRRFSGVYVPDAVLAEMGTLGPSGRTDARDQLEPRNAFLRDELAALKFLRAAHSAGKLAVVGKSATDRCYGGAVPSIRVEPAVDRYDDDDVGAAAAAAALQPGTPRDIGGSSEGDPKAPGRTICPSLPPARRVRLRGEHCNVA